MNSNLPLSIAQVAAAQAQAAHAARYGGYPYSQASAAVPYGAHPMGLIHGQGTRKNATRESTQQLKLWLQEHQKNPYPTKAEKVYLALLSGMTLTQVSTWFANARRRLKKENKWSPDGCDDNSEDGNHDSVSDSSQTDSSSNGSRNPSVQPGQDDSGFSGSEKSDRDAGSPPVVIPSQPMVNFLGHHPMMSMMGHVTIPTVSPTRTVSQTNSPPTKSSPISAGAPAVHVPQFLPRQSATSPISAKRPRQARSVWSIADITGCDSDVARTTTSDDNQDVVEDDITVDVTA